MPICRSLGGISVLFFTQTWACDEDQKIAEKIGRKFLANMVFYAKTKLKFLGFIFRVICRLNSILMLSKRWNITIYFDNLRKIFDFCFFLSSGVFFLVSSQYLWHLLNIVFKRLCLRTYEGYLCKGFVDIGATTKEKFSPTKLVHAEQFEFLSILRSYLILLELKVH